MQSRVNRMSRNSAQGAHVLPSACAVLTCVFDCACVISAQSMSNTRVPVSFLGHSINTRMQVDSSQCALAHHLKCVPLVDLLNALLWPGRKGPVTYNRYFALGMQLSPALQSPFSFHLGCGYARKKNNITIPALFL